MVKGQWGVWCEVWGGVTGSRAAWLKSNGELARFDTFEEADAEAQKCNRQRDSGYGSARFRYTALGFGD